MLCSVVLRRIALRCTALHGSVLRHAVFHGNISRRTERQGVYIAVHGHRCRRCLGPSDPKCARAQGPVSLQMELIHKELLGTP